MFSRQRKKQIEIVLSIFIIVLINTGISFAQSDYIIFGPKQYDKPKGSPVTYTDTFQAYTGINYTLLIQSGQDGLSEVKNVSVSINGVEVLDSSDLRKSNPSTKTISLQSNNTLKVVLKGQGGNFITVKVLAPPLNIISVSPASGETILKPEITVTGRVINFTGNETGVTVNGKVANVYGNQFVTNSVSLVEGVNTITVTAKDTTNNSATASVTVNAVTTGSYVKLSSSLDSSIAPLTANFSTSTSTFTPASYQMDYEGDGIIDYTGTTFDNIGHVYTSEGIFYPTVTAIDNQGNTYSDSIAITVLSKTEMDSLLKGKWDGIKEAMISKDVSKATGYFIDHAQERYSGIFTALGDRLPQVVQDMQTISMIYLRNGVAKYRIRRTEAAGEITYYIYFVKDENGLWKIQQF